MRLVGVCPYGEAADLEGTPAEFINALAYGVSTRSER